MASSALESTSRSSASSETSSCKRAEVMGQLRFTMTIAKACGDLANSKGSQLPLHLIYMQNTCPHHLPDVLVEGLLWLASSREHWSWGCSCHWLSKTLRLAASGLWISQGCLSSQPQAGTCQGISWTLPPW